MKLGIIYKWTNKINNKSYIGQTCNEIGRKNDHLKPRVKSHFHSAILKYGENNFLYEVIERDIPEHLLNEREIYWINFFDTYNNGYNMTKGGEGTRGFSNNCSEETKQKISKKNKGKIPWNKGIKLNNEQKENITKKHKQGYHLSEEHKKKISNALKGRPCPNKGKHFSAETKKKVSENSKKMWENPEYREKMYVVIHKSRKTKGIKRGRNPIHSEKMKNKIHINNGEIGKMIDIELLSDYLNNGWIKGRLKRK